MSRVTPLSIPVLLCLLLAAACNKQSQPEQKQVPAAAKQVAILVEGMT